MGRRTKSSVKSRPKFKQKRRMKDRRMKAKKAAWHKRGLAKGKKKRAKRGKRAAIAARDSQGLIRAGAETDNAAGDGRR